jgi:hypothetical protein
MANMPELRRRTRLAMAVLVGINVLALGALVFMMVRGTSSLPAEFEGLHQQVQTKKATVVQPQTVDQRITEAREQIAHFYEGRFFDGSAAIFETLGRVANENHVRMTQASYKINDEAKDTNMPAGLRQVLITASLNGNYIDAMKFINALEREKAFFIVNTVSLGDQKAGNVQLRVDIETYVRGEA